MSQLNVLQHVGPTACNGCSHVHQLLLLPQVPVAIAAWRELLQGRFRLLDRWCSFMTDQYKALVVTEDTWVQVGDRTAAGAGVDT